MVESLLKIDHIVNDVVALENRDLYWAVMHENLFFVKELLKIQRVINNLASDKSNILALAAMVNNLEVVKELLQVETVKNTAAANDNEALINAILNNNATMVEELLKIPVIKDNVAKNDNQAVNLAVSKGYYLIAEKLAEIPVVKDKMLHDMIFSVLPEKLEFRAINNNALISLSFKSSALLEKLHKYFENEFSTLVSKLECAITASPDEAKTIQSKICMLRDDVDAILEAADKCNYTEFCNLIEKHLKDAKKPDLSKGMNNVFFQFNNNSEQLKKEIIKEIQVMRIDPN